MRKKTITLAKFLTMINDNPKALARLKSDIATVLSEHGLKKADQEVLLSGDPKKIKLALKKEKEVVAIMIGSAIMSGSPPIMMGIASTGKGSKKAKP